MKATMHHTVLVMLCGCFLLCACRSTPAENDIQTPAALDRELSVPATPRPAFTRVATNATPSGTPVPATARPTVTPTPTLTATTPPQPAVILTYCEGQQAIPPIAAAVRYQEESTVYFLDDLGQVAGRVEVSNGWLRQFAWFDQGCELLMFVQSLRTWDEQIVILDLSSGEVTTLSNYEFPQADSEADRFAFSQLSPDRQWLAYTVWSGEQYYRGAEYQDVETVRLDGSAVPFALSERGGVWWHGGAWSPDGRRYAYADYDENGQSQLFHSAPDGSDRVQVTSFERLAEDVGPVRWSPDGSRLAFSSWAEDHSSGSMWMATADGTAVVRLGPEGMPLVVAEGFWWSNDGETILALTVSNEGEEPPGGVYWLGTDGAVQHFLSRDAFPLGTIYEVLITADPDIVRFGSFYEYNRRDQSLVRWPADEHLPDWPLYTIEAPPGGSVDVASCSE